MDTEDKDALWHLLGKAKTPEVSPFFARNVVRQLRLAESENKSFAAWLLAKWRVATLGAAAAILLAVATGEFVHRSATTRRIEIAQLSDDPDYDAIDHLDELLAYEENSIWLENSAE